MKEKTYCNIFWVLVYFLKLIVTKDTIFAKVFLKMALGNISNAPEVCSDMLRIAPGALHI